MAALLSVTLEDVNGERASMSCWLEPSAQADMENALDRIKNATNARIVEAFKTQPVAIVTLTGNTREEANLETVKIAAMVRAYGIDIASAASPKSEVSFGIPAPKGDLIPFGAGNPHAAQISALLFNIRTASGVTPDNLKSVKYQGRR